MSAISHEAKVPGMGSLSPVLVQLESWVKGAESRHGSLIKANRQMRCTLEKSDKVSILARSACACGPCPQQRMCAVLYACSKTAQ